MDKSAPGPGRMASWFTGGDHFQRFAARDAAGGAGYGSVVIDLSARLYRRAACHRAAGGLSPETPAPGAACALDHRLIRGGARLSATHGAGPAAHYLGAFDCVYWSAAADDRPLWRTARRRTPAAGFLDLFAAGQPAGGGIRPDAKCGGLTQRRSADAGGGYRLRPRLCGRGEADAGARRLAGDLLGAGDCPAVDAPRLAAGSARILACHLGLLLGRRSAMCRCSAC